MNINRGIIHILIASFFFSIVNALVKYLDGIPAIEIVFWRSVVSLIICYYTIFKEKLKIVTPHTNLLLARGIFGALALSLYFYTIQKMPLATAVTILYLAPIFTIVFAVFIVKEKPAKKQIPFFILCFIGAALLKNFDPRVETLHFFMGILAAIFAGLAYNVIRLLKDKAHPHVVIFYFPLVTIPLCLPWLIPVWVKPNLQEFFLLISVGVATQMAQVYMTKAYMNERASVISQYNYTTSVFAFFTGIIFFNEYLNAISLVGLALIIIGIVFSTKYAPKQS